MTNIYATNLLLKNNTATLDYKMCHSLHTYKFYCHLFGDKNLQI